MPPKKPSNSKADQAKAIDEKKVAQKPEKDSLEPPSADQKIEGTSLKRSARIQQKIEKPAKEQPKIEKKEVKSSSKVASKEAKLKKEFAKAAEAVKIAEVAKKPAKTESKTTSKVVTETPKAAPAALPVINFSNVKILPKGSLKINPFALKQDTAATTKSPVIISGIKINQLNLTPVKLSDLKILPENFVKFTNLGGSSLNISKAFSLNPQAPKDEKKVIKRPSEVFADSSPKKVIVERIETKKVMKVVEKPIIVKRENSISSSGSSITIKTDPYESRREGLRGVRININDLLGRKSMPLPKKPKIQELPFKPIATPTFNTFSVHDERFQTFECKKCLLSFEARKDFINHRKIHKKSNFSCEKCNQTFRFQSSHENHVCQFWCNVCHKSISNKANLKIHLSYVHGIGEAKLYTCDCCGRTYKSKRNIDSHMKNHMESTPFNCGICGKGFSHLGALKIHMWNHRDAVNCEFCGRKFKPRSLYYHIKKCQSDQSRLPKKKNSRSLPNQLVSVTEIVDEMMEEEIGEQQMVEEYIEEYIEGEEEEDVNKWNYQIQFVKVENN